MKTAALWCFLVAAAPALAAPATGHGVHFVYLVRHGIYDRDNNVDDRAHNGMNAKGHQQAKLAGERLAKLPVHVDRLISSELLRAKETADDIGKAMHMTPARDALLNECTPSSIEKSAAPRATSATADCDAARALAWTRYFGPTPDHDTVDVLVSHGNVIRWTLLRALGADTKGWPLLDSANGSITIIAVWPDGTTSVASYDDVGHIPPELQTWTGRGGGAGAEH